MTKRREAEFSSKQIEQLHIALEAHDFSSKQIEQLHIALEAHAFEQARLVDPVDPRPPTFKHIEDYSSDGLKAAIDVAQAEFGTKEFWKLVNGVDAFFEQRRRKRGWGLTNYRRL